MYGLRRTSIRREEIERVDDHETSEINYRGNMG
jgi:hypothetical protein